MVCSLCNCDGHNKTTCPFRASPAEKRIAAELGEMLPLTVVTKKENKPLEGLAGCKNIFKEPKVITFKKTKKVKKIKKVKKPLEGLAGCVNIFKEPKVITVKKTSKTCSGCGEKGHNTRSCVNVCLPCSPPKAYCFAGLSDAQAVNLARIMDCTPVY
jgi:hypothetical protein